MRQFTDEEFWNLVDDFENGTITHDDAVKTICEHNKSYDCAITDISLLLKRDTTKEEKQYVKGYYNEKNNKRKNIAK